MSEDAPEGNVTLTLSLCFCAREGGAVAAAQYSCQQRTSKTEHRVDARVIKAWKRTHQEGWLRMGQRIAFLGFNERGRSRHPFRSTD